MRITGVVSHCSFDREKEKMALVTLWECYWWHNLPISEDGQVIAQRSVSSPLPRARFLSLFKLFEKLAENCKIYLKKARFLNLPDVPEIARSKASSLLAENRPFPFWDRQTIPSSSGILASALQNRNSLSKSIYSDSHRRCISNWRFLHVDFWNFRKARWIPNSTLKSFCLLFWDTRDGKPEFFARDEDAILPFLILLLLSTFYETWNLIYY